MLNLIQLKKYLFDIYYRQDIEFVTIGNIKINKGLNFME